MAQAYREGDWLWIPLRRSGLFAIGRIARVGPAGKVITLYGFGPPRTSLPSTDEFVRLRASSAAFVGMSGDLGILNGDWKVIPQPRGTFNRDEWPMPSFGQYSDPAPVGQRIDYVADAPNTDPIITMVPAHEARLLPPDGVSGYVALEVHLCQALGVRVQNEPELDQGSRPMTAEHYVYFASQRVAKSAAQQMLNAVPGATVEIRQSDDTWLVLLRHRNEGNLNFDQIIDRLRRIASQRSGEYDGWERDA